MSPLQELRITESWRVVSGRKRRIPSKEITMTQALILISIFALGGLFGFFMSNRKQETTLPQPESIPQEPQKEGLITDGLLPRYTPTHCERILINFIKRNPHYPKDRKGYETRTEERNGLTFKFWSRNGNDIRMERSDGFVFVQFENQDHEVFGNVFLDNNKVESAATVITSYNLNENLKNFLANN